MHRSSNNRWNDALSPSDSILAPEAPLAMRITVSLVLVSPSMVIRLKDPSTDRLNADWRSATAMPASVQAKQSMVAMSGRIMPAPLATATIR